MPKSQRMTLSQLEELAFREGLALEPDPDLNLTFAMRGRIEVAYAITDTSRPGVSSR